MKQGTIPFLSISLLRQISEALQQKPLKHKHVYKEGWATFIQIGGGHANDDFKVRHVPADDAESLFYVLIWILVLYDGPLGWERQNFNFESSILSWWSEGAIQNLESMRNSKVTFIVNPKPTVLSKYVSPYFSDLVPLAEQWRQIFRHAFNNEQLISFDSLLEVTNKFLGTMLPEDPLEITNEQLTMQAEKNSLRLPPSSVEDVTLPTVAGRKHGVQSMGDLPHSTLSKRLKGVVYTTVSELSMFPHK